MTSHMLQVEWNADQGWGKPEIKPYGKLDLEPASLCLHYGLECFEGMKAYKDANNKIRLFRPMDNMNRLNASSQRISLPGFNGKEFLECIKEYVKVEEPWIPRQRGFSLYLRPTMIATQNVLGVQGSNRALLFVISCPVGPYYKSGFKPVKLLADDKNVRAWPGGVGQYKIGGNYAPGITLQRNAAAQGYSQILWLMKEGDEHYVTEVGTMNMCVYWLNQQGEKELITPPLDGTILPGVTRSSVLDLARQWGIKVNESRFTMKQILQALKENRLLEAFGCGTACIISPIQTISFQGKDYDIPLGSEPNALAGPLAAKLNEAILSIQYGETPSEWSVLA